jgi:MFS family permease
LLDIAGTRGGLRRQGWVVVAACFTVMYGVWNSHAGFGVFLPVLADEFGWSRGAISVTASINLIVGGVLAFLVGAASDRFGPRPVLLLSSVLVGGLYALAATIGALWHFYLVLGFLAGVGMASIYLVPAATVSRWFVGQRGLALGILFSGLNLAYLTGPLLSAYLIQGVGWRTAYVVLGVIVWAVAIPASLLARDPPGGSVEAPGDPGAAPGGLTARESLGDVRLWLLTAAWLLHAVSVMMIAVHLVPYVKDRGVALESASLALTVYGVGNTLGRILFGGAADRLGTKPMFRLCMTMQIAALVWIVTGPSLATLAGVIFWYGLSSAGTDTTIAKGAVETFGVRAIGAVMGIMSFGWRIGAAAGPALAGFLYDATGAYTLPFALGAGCLALGFALFTLGTSARLRAAA